MLYCFIMCRIKIKFSYLIFLSYLIDKEILSFHSEGIFYIIKLIYFRHDHYEKKFKSLRTGRHEKQYSRNGSHGNTLPEVNCNQANSYQKFVMSYWLAFVPKALNMLSILKCNTYVLAIGLLRAFPSNKMFPLDGIIPSNLEIQGKIFS